MSIKTYRCCSTGSNVVEVIRILNPKTKTQEERITCNDGDSSQEDCPDGSFQEILLESDLYSIQHSKEKGRIEIKNKCDSTEFPITINADNDNYCVSTSYSAATVKCL